MTNWLIQTPVPIFIDNSVWRSLSFNLENTFFDTLYKAVSSKDVVITYTDISKNEFFKHCDELLKEDQRKLEKLSTLKAVLGDRIKDLEGLATEITANHIWEKFEARFAPVNVSGPVDWQPIFKNYFELQPPFSAKKKNEFADAFNMAMLLNYMKNRLVVLASDPDFKAWANTQDKITHFYSTSAFTDEYLKLREHEFAGRVLAAIEQIKNEVASDLSKKYEDDYYFEVDSGDSEIESVYIPIFNVNSIEIVSTDSEHGTATVKMRFTGRADLDITSEVRLRDPVDKDYIFVGTNRNSGEVKIEAEVDVLLKFDDIARNFESYELDNDEFHAELFEIPADWETFLNRSDDWPEE
jgi:hypothetical protein